jgi:hypothetical protein
MEFASTLASNATVGVLCALVAGVLLWKRLWYGLLGLTAVENRRCHRGLLADGRR